MPIFQQNKALVGWLASERFVSIKPFFEALFRKAMKLESLIIDDLTTAFLPFNQEG